MKTFFAKRCRLLCIVFLWACGANISPSVAQIAPAARVNPQVPQPSLEEVDHNLDYLPITSLVKLAKDRIDEKSALVKAQPDATNPNPYDGTTASIVNRAAKNPCLSFYDGPRGEPAVALSDYFVDMLKGIGQSLQCRMNLSSCQVFPQPASSEDTTGYQAAIRAASHATHIAMSGDPIRDLSRDLLELDTMTDTAIEDMISAFEHPGRTLTSYDEVVGIATAVFGRKLLSTNLTIQKALEKKIKEVATKDVKSAVSKLGKQKEIAALEKMQKFLKRLRRTEGAVKRLEKRAAENTAQQAVGATIGTLDSAAQQRKRRTLSQVAGWVKKGASHPNTIKALGKMGIAVGVVTSIAIGTAIEGVPVVRDVIQGQRTRGVTEYYERCSGSKSTYMSAELAHGGAYPAFESDYYDAFTKRYKNPADNTNECKVYPVINLNKFERLTTTLPTELIFEIAADPLICEYVEALAKEYKINETFHPAKSTMVARCPTAAERLLNPKRRKVSVALDDPSLKAILGDRVAFEYAVTNSGAYSPLSISSPRGFRPNMVRAFNLNFDSVSLGPNLRPIHVGASNANSGSAAFVHQCSASKSRNRMRRCWDNYDQFDFTKGYPLTDFGLQTSMQSCTGSRTGPRCRRLEFTKEFQQFSTETGYASFYDGTNSKKKNDTLSNQQKQYADYSKKVMVGARTLFPAVAEIAACCAMDESPTIPFDHPMRNQCKERYRIDQPQHQSVEDLRESVQ